MGLCGSSNADKDLTPEEIERRKQEAVSNKKIESDMATGKHEDEAWHKLLLLGAGESGKSTLFKQMITIYGKGFSQQERQSYIRIIHGNVIGAMKTLCQHSDQFGPVAVALQEDKNFVDSLSGNEDMDSKIGTAIKNLWADAGIRATFEKRSHFQLIDSAPYYFDMIDQICQPTWVPTEQDVLRSRAPTTGIVENEFIIDSNKFRMFDVGGQRNERKKWIHCFEKVTAVVFVVAMSEYDQRLFEDESQNRLMESLDLFDETCNSRWFRKTAMILFLNKRDLFAEKIEKHPLKDYFSDYDGKNEYEPAARYIEQKFLSKNKSPAKQVYVHITCATDTSNIKRVFNTVKDIVVRQALDESGLGLA